MRLCPLMYRGAGSLYTDFLMGCMYFNLLAFVESGFVIVGLRIRTAYEEAERK